ncbi:peptidoglycan bridge formation glycyltransferase FemA/FemB family protein, partial [bacterium]|nr:peptidoglycan bridge formation glycyltransferase FemA/FemB family protein [bacterium]
MRVSLDKPEEELLKGIRRTLRQEINASKRQGVSIETQGQSEDENRFCEIMAALENVKNSVHHTKAYYQTVLK